MPFFFPLFSPPPPAAPCCPPSTRTMAARWCGPRPHPAPPPLRASTGRYAAPLPRSAGAAWAPTPPTITPSTTSGSTSTEMCHFSAEAAATGSGPVEAPCPWSPAALTPPSHSSAGGEDWWTTAMSSWLTRHTSGTTRRRPGGNSGSEYRSLFTTRNSSVGVSWICYRFTLCPVFEFFLMFLKTEKFF